MSRTTSFRRSLLTNLVAVVLLLGLAIVTMMVLRTRQASEKLSATLVSQVSRSTETKLRGLFEPVSRQAATAREWGLIGLLDVDEPDRMRALLTPFLDEFEWTDSVFIADDRGHEYLLQAIDGTWSDRQTRRSEWGDLQRTRRWTDAPEEAAATESSTDYDPRSRPWFRGAVDLLARSAGEAGEGPVYWTEPYTFYSSGVPGITASAAFPCGARTCVVGLDMALEEVTRFTGGIRILDQGTVFVLSEDGRFIGVPRSLRADRTIEDPQTYLLRTPAELGTAAARDAADLLIGDENRWNRAIRVVSDGGAWWGQITPYELPAGRVFLVGVAVPENDILGNLVRQRLWVAGITLAVLGLAIWRAVAMARGYGRPIEDLVAESDRISQGDLEPGPPIRSRVTEIHQLAQAHDKMREGLETLLKLESDLRMARKIQQQTWPESLPRLEGFDLAAWSEPADDTGGDSYDVIGLIGGGDGEPFTLTEGDADKALLLLADATGHGIGPALSVTQLRAMLRMAVRLTSDLSSLAGQINDQLLSDLPRGRFITAWLGLLDAADRRLTTFSAGQAPLILYRAGEDRFELPGSNATPFGLFPGMKTETTGPIRLEPGDLYAVISDGIFEAVDAEDEEMGTERVCEVIRRYRDAPAAEILDRLRQATDAFTGGAPFTDDRTIVLIRRLPGQTI